jgi:uncharacterized protein
MPLAGLRDRVSTWPKWVEATIVIVGAFGLAFISTARYLFDSRSHAAITEHHLHFLLIYEPVIFLVLGSFLYARGWTFKRVGLAPRHIDTLIGVGIAIGAYTTYAALWILASAVKLQPAYLHGASSVVSGHFAMPTVVATSIVNALFEEIFVCGYVICAAKETGHLAIGVNASITIRLAYHLYQGGAGVVGIVPFGLISAVWFSKTGRLWPVVVAHALTDFAGLAGNI